MEWTTNSASGNSHVTSKSQLNLFDRSDYEKQERLDAAIDRIRERYGVDSVKRAVFVESPIDHMCGRATREKRKVDYSKIHIE